ncbi:hypothetical protein BaRGS_00016033 [Batillaria attramentaria]|uniref:Uncharacterized protein n=1 Tax=Batillaria attramentaria TaxID=370345 RepID=A0ABD0KZP5_9CAEN
MTCRNCQKNEEHSSLPLEFWRVQVDEFICCHSFGAMTSCLVESQMGFGCRVYENPKATAVTTTATDQPTNPNNINNIDDNDNNSNNERKSL